METGLFVAGQDKLLYDFAKETGYTLDEARKIFVGHTKRVANPSFDETIQRELGPIVEVVPISKLEDLWGQYEARKRAINDETHPSGEAPPIAPQSFEPADPIPLRPGVHSDPPPAPELEPEIPEGGPPREGVLETFNRDWGYLQGSLQAAIRVQGEHHASACEALESSHEEERVELSNTHMRAMDSLLSTHRAERRSLLARHAHQTEELVTAYRELGLDI